MDYIVHGILQARILEWVAVAFSRRSSQPRSPALQADSLPAELPRNPPLMSEVTVMVNVMGSKFGTAARGCLRDP